MFFANAELFHDRVLDAVATSPTPVRWLVVAAEPVTSVDVTAADILAELDETLHAAGIELCFAEMKDPVKDKLKRFGLFARLGEESFFPTMGAAVSSYRTILNRSFQPDMPDETIKPSKPVLDPIDRVSEVLFGLIMVLTFTGSLSVAEAGRDDVRTMLIGALGCNVAWGIIDAMLYLMGCLADKGQGLMTYLAVRKATDPHKAQRLIADALPPVVASIMEPAELETIRRRLMQLAAPPERAHLSEDEWVGSIGVFLIVFVSTFPVVIPFIFMQNVRPALRLSNAIAIVMLFLTGYAFGTHNRASPVACRSCDGCSRVHARRHDHGTGRISHVRLLAGLAIAIAFMDRAVFAQAPTNAPISAATTTPPEAAEDAWLFSASAYTYFVPTTAIRATHLHRGPRLAAP